MQWKAETPTETFQTLVLLLILLYSTDSAEAEKIKAAMLIA